MIIFITLYISLKLFIKTNASLLSNKLVWNILITEIRKSNRALDISLFTKIEKILSRLFLDSNNLKSVFYQGRRSLITLTVKQKTNLRLLAMDHTSIMFLGESKLVCNFFYMKITLCYSFVCYVSNLICSRIKIENAIHWKLLFQKEEWSKVVNRLKQNITNTMLSWIYQ